MLRHAQQHYANRLAKGLLIRFRDMNRVETRQKTRRANFARLRRKFKTAAQMADVLGEGFGSSYISQLLSGHRGIGDDVADKIEARLGLPSMWLDQEDKGERQADWDKLVWLFEHADNEVSVMLTLLTTVMYEKKRRQFDHQSKEVGEVGRDTNRITDAHDGRTQRHHPVQNDDD